MLCFAAFSQILPLIYIYYLNSSKNIFIVKMFSPKQWYLPGGTSGGFCDVDLHFVFILHLSMFFIHIFFSTSSLTLPWIINRFLEPFCTFSPTHRRVICDAFIFQPSRYLLTASATVFEWAFFTHKHFLPYAPSQHLGTTCFYKGFPGSWQLFLEICRASKWSSKHRPCPSDCLIYSNPQSVIHLKFVFIHVNIAKVLLVV